jgi:hypothetical protein
MFGLFKSKEERRLNDLFRETEKHVTREYEQIGKLGLEIVRASFETKERIKHLLLIADSKQRLEREILLYFESVYFFYYFGRMHASVLLPEGQAHKTVAFLSQLIPTVAVDAYFAHWPEDLKGKMREEFEDKFMLQECSYADLTERAASHDERFTGTFRLLAENIVRLCERESEWESLGPKVFDVAFDEARKSRFDLVTKSIAANV